MYRSAQQQYFACEQQPRICFEQQFLFAVSSSNVVSSNVCFLITTQGHGSSSVATVSCFEHQQF